MNRKIRVLLVDDDSLLRKLIADQLSRAEFEATPVASGREALDTLREADYDVVLLDIMMPDLSGLDGLQPRGRIAVVLHLFYAELWDEMREAIEHISLPFDLFVSLVKGASSQMRETVLEAFPHAYVFDFQDRGRDIGAFLVFLESGVLFKYALVCKLHTKRSPHRADGDAWRRTLIAGVLGSSALVERIVAAFDADPALGMVVAEGQIYDGPEQWRSNEARLAQ